MNKSYTHIDHIEKGKYEGYIWYSNKEKPDVYLKQEIEEISLNVGKVPFIIESLLYDGTYSYSIKMIDGKYCAVRYDLNLLKNEEFEVHKYLSNLKVTTGRLVFREYWKPVPDENCLGMETLQPKEIIFVGFEEKED